MSTPILSTQANPGRKPYRIRPAIIIVTLQWTLWLFIPLLFHGDIITTLSVFGGMAGGLAILAWWLFFSRIPLLFRWVGFLTMVLAILALTQLADRSITTAYQGMMIYAYAIPTLSLGVVAWVILCRKLSAISRWLTMISFIRSFTWSKDWKAG